MITSLTFCAVHIIAALGFAHLYRNAPCWMQKGVVALLGVAMLLIGGGYLVDSVHAIDALIPWWGADRLKYAGYLLLNIGVLLYVFRLHFQGESWKQLSRHSRPLPG